VKAIYSDGDASSLGPARQVNDVWMILDPWAPLTLATLMRESRITQWLPTESKVKIFYQMSQALVHLHHRSVIHRDVKPENVLIKNRPPNVWAVLADFGHATQEERSQDHMKGIIPYLPPEILERKYKRARSCQAIQFSSNKSDIFSLGLTAFQLVHNLSDEVFNVPIENKRHQAFNKKLEQSGSWVDRLLQTMIAWNAVDRPSAEEVLKQPWPDDCFVPVEAN
jgi:serine/threonine protein kinase